MTEYRVVVIGAPYVGKSSFIIRYVQRFFAHSYDPTIEDLYRKQIEVDNENLLLTIIDTIAQDSYTILRDKTYRSGHGFVMIYSITSEASLEELFVSREQIERVKEGERIAMVIAGNKSDLETERKVSLTKVQQIASQWECPFLEVSAKLDINIDEVIISLVREIKKCTQQPLTETRKNKKKCIIL
uniref:Uncharacterized protein n=1 Tax=Arcella intermedia TaxID=1963864 RepID=A0A6B2LKH8_9EUKA|eukprot:TRINITY_DN1955_c0_g1_i1.p1 TRINITY_DN1955_c0_g1~~TRINITY_DN1955_c0_g1_i1.p1  ORF type:complete len:186 (+),score=26.98 TRINITY_DN1955_c0_g1_i1:94-651(+)